MVHKFDKPYDLVSMTHSPKQLSQFVMYFVAKDEITYIINNLTTTTIHKFGISNIKFMDNINIPSVINYKSKVKSQIMTFMMANRLVNNRIPKLLVHKIICFINKN